MTGVCGPNARTGVVDIARRITSQIKIELERAWRTRTMCAVTVGMLFVAGLVAFGATHQAHAATGALTSDFELRAVLDGVSALRIFVILLGILSVTSEYHHGDVVWRYLAEPSRGVLMAAKATTNAMVGAILGLVALQLGILVTMFQMGTPVSNLGLTTAAAAQAVAGSVLSVTLAGVLGVGIGAAVRNQTAAIVGTLVAVLLIEPLITALVPAVAAYLPNAAAAAAAGGSAGAHWVRGLLATVIYAAAAIAAGTVVCRNRDV
jgi:ABC-type transport system involved in multi-copper enzyme maturation permease subunit